MEAAWGKTKSNTMKTNEWLTTYNLGHGGIFCPLTGKRIQGFDLYKQAREEA